MMNNKKDILIVGAGSTGLTCALFLSEFGYKPRIVDNKSKRLEISKALGVNPKSLKIFETTEVTKRFIENGWRLDAMNIWCNNKMIYNNDFSKVNHPYPFVIVQPQYETEYIIEAALNNRGIFVEREMEFVSVIQEREKCFVRFKKSEGEQIEIETDFVIGADGAHSAVRKALEIPFQGWQRDEVLNLYDLELETPLSTKVGHWLFHREGGMLMIHIKNGIWRVGGSIKDVLNYIPEGTKAGRIVWETAFTIRENIALQYQKGNVFLLGDAAHVHSPVGGKGMNLCMEDAFLFASLFKEGRQNDFEKIRRPQIAKTISAIGKLTTQLAGHNIVSKTIRGNMDKLSFILPLTMPRMREFMLGIK